jgi:hypothetical protein
MPIEKSKPSQNQKPTKVNKKPSSELGDDDLRSVSGGLANTGGVKIVDDGGCITKAP